MTYTEITKDLFTMPDDYYLAHCISADFKMGAGIAVQFNKHFDMKNILTTKHPKYYDYFVNHRIGGDCILEGRVLNIITKELYYNKPTIITMMIALVKLKQVCLENNIKKIAMPTIGCGLDGLKWEIVSKTIQDTLRNTDIEIVVCKL